MSSHTTEQVFAVTVSSRNQVTVPKAVRDALGLEAGRKLTFILRGGEVLLRPERPRRRNFMDAIGTLTPPEGMTAEEYISEMRHAPGDREILQSGPGVKSVTRLSDLRNRSRSTPHATNQQNRRRHGQRLRYREGDGAAICQRGRNRHRFRP